MSENLPLTTLLSWVWIAHTIEVDNAFEAAGSERVGHHVRISLPMWTNGLRFIDEGGVTVDELRARARASSSIGGLERWGWISVGETVGTKRRDGYGSHRGVKGDTVVRPTDAGTYARRLWPCVLSDVESRWRTRFGGEVVDVLGDALLAAVTSMPWSPPEVGSSDGFYTHVVAGDAGDGQRPLAALLGQVLTAFTLDHEEKAEVSLPVGGNVLRVIGSDVVRNRDLPVLTGISKEGIAMAVGYLQRRGLATSAPERTISLTPDGLDALDDYWHRSAQPKDNRLRDALTAILAQPDALSVGLVPPEGCWRGERPYLARTRRLMADPTGVLPWHPMVTSRAGWPDAS